MRTGGKNILGAARLGQRFEPLILRAETTVEPSSNASPNNNALINPTGEPWEIHEIKFAIRRETDSTLTRLSGAMIDLNLSWLGKPITDGFVPIWNCMAQQSAEEHRAKMDIASTAGMVYFLGQDCFYSWKLDHPLFIPPRKAISVEFRNNGLVNAVARTSIACIGRVLPRSAMPSKVKVPYVSAWKSRFYDYAASGGPEVSPETVLFNQFKSPMTVERFVGRMTSRIQGVAVTPYNPLYIDQISGLAFRGGAFSAKQRMTDGHIVARNWVRFGDLFGWRNFKSTSRHILPPGVGHVVELRKNAVTAGASYTIVGDITAAASQASVSLVGWREEEIP